MVSKILAQIETDFNDIAIPRQGLGDSELQSAIGFFFIIAGIISVIMIIIGGYWYMLSAGDPQKTKRGKDTILYAVVGLVISLSAWSIIIFVMDGA